MKLSNKSLEERFLSLLTTSPAGPKPAEAELCVGLVTMPKRASKRDSSSSESCSMGASDPADCRARLGLSMLPCKFKIQSNYFFIRIISNNEYCRYSLSSHDCQHGYDIRQVVFNPLGLASLHLAWTLV